VSLKGHEDKIDLITFKVPALKEGILRERYVIARLFDAGMNNQDTF
jgi:hypothetical protein